MVEQKKKNSLREDFVIQKQDLHSLYLRFCAAASFSYSQEQNSQVKKPFFTKERE